MRLDAVRRVPPVHSPLPVSAVARALGGRTDPLPALRALLADRFEADAVVLCDSGTSALRLAIGLESDRADAPVALPAFGCFDIVTAAVGAAVEPVFYDVDPDTLGPDFASLEGALEGGARTIVAAHLYGVPVDWDRLAALAARFDARVIEDAAMGHGGQWRGSPLGSLGTVSILSFGRGKGWTGAGGGALLARGPAAERVAALPPLPPAGGPLRTGRTLVAALGQAVFGSPELYGIPASLPGLRLGETVYRPPTPMIGMSPACARIALATRPRADGEVEVRRATSRRYRTTLAAENVRHVVVPSGGASGALRHPVRIPDGLAATGSEAAVRRLGIERSYPRVLPSLEAVRSGVAAGSTRWPGARRLVDELVTLPTHSLLDEEDAVRIMEMMQSRGS